MTNKSQTISDEDKTTFQFEFVSIFNLKCEP